MKRSAGFTLIGVLVVIAIIGVLVALLLPAIQAVRESGRRTMCENNLRQVMLAMQQYELSNLRFPSGTIDKQGPVRNLNKGDHHGWTLALLPYVDQEPLARHIDTSVSIYAPANAKVREFELYTLFCPSEPGPRDGSNYAACHSSIETPIDAENDGSFMLNRQFKRSDIRDGLTYTAFLGEKIVDPWDRGWYSGTRSTIRNTGCQLAYGRASYHRIDKPSASDAITIGENPGAPNPPVNATSWRRDSQYIPAFLAAESAGDAEKEAGVAPSIPSVLLGGPPRDNDDVGGFGSHHKGTVTFAFGDGSLRRVSLMIDTKVLARYGSRNDGEFPPELPAP